MGMGMRVRVRVRVRMEGKAAVCKTRAAWL
jgi:hypothetical protein